MYKMSLDRMNALGGIKPAYVRDELYSAYVNERVIPSRFETPAISHSIGDKRVYGKGALDILSIFGVTVYGKIQYQTHGLAIVRVPVEMSHGTLIDLHQLQGASPSNQPQYIWFKNRSKAWLDMLIASGKQPVARGAVRLDRTRTLEGVLLEFNFRVSPDRQTPYDESLTPLYGKSIQKL